MKELHRTMKLGLYLAAGLGIFAAAPALASAATLSLSPTTGSHEAGSTFEVKIQLDTNGVTTSATDAVIRFDPNVLQVVDADSTAEGTQVLAGSLYSQTTYNVVDNGSGKISFSGAKSGASPGYSGSGTLATITFQGSEAATDSEVTFDYTSGSTTDSNVISQADSSDLLTSVTDAKYTITGGDGSDDSDDDSLGAGGTGGDDGTGGSSSVADSGLDLQGYMVLTVLSLIGAGFFLSRRPKTR